MRNLKKVLSVLLVVAMLATAMVPAFAADTATISADAKIAADLGMLQGTGSGVTAEYTATGLTRVQAAILLLRLKGLEADAKAFKTTDNFADVKADAWYAPITAYLKANPALGFIGDGKNFNAEEPINAQQYYKVVLTALGYEIADGKDSSFEKVLEFAKTKGLVKLDATKKQLTVDDLAVATVEGLKTAVKGGTTTLVATLAAKDAAFAAKAKATGLIAEIKDFELTNKAKTMTVKFGTAPADATKVVFTVLKDGAVTIAATFTQSATDKTEFNFTSASSLLAGTYKVSVKDGDKDLGSKSVTVVDEKVAKIEIVSSKIVRSSSQKGTAAYKVYNQYGEDITETSLAGSLDVNSPFISGSGSTSVYKGLITFESATATGSESLESWGYNNRSAVVSIYDKAGVIATKELTVSNTIGDIASLTIKGIVGDKIIEKNSSETFYLNFEAKDSTGSLITDLETLKAAITIYDSGNLLDADWAPDSINDKKGVIKIIVNGVSDVSPYVGVGIHNISLVSLSGKSASYNAEVKLGSVVDQFILQKPVVEVAEDIGYVEIPFTALDTKGEAVTSYSKLSSSVTVSDGSPIAFTQQPDGTAKLFYPITGNKNDVKSLTAQVKSSYKNSTINFTLKEAAVPKTISALPFDEYLYYNNSSEKGFQDIKVSDQYGAVVDLGKVLSKLDKVTSSSNAATAQYEYFIYATTASTVFTINTPISYGPGVKKIKVTANDLLTAGTTSGDIIFKLYKTPAGTALPTSNPAGNSAYIEVASAVKTLYNVAAKDIVDFSVDAVAKLYATAPNAYKAEVAESVQYATGLTIKGLTAAGKKVAISSTVNTNASTLATIGVVDYTTTDSAFKVDFQNKRVYAEDNNDGDFDDEFAGKLIVTFKGYNGVISTKSVDLTASEKAPYATAISVALANGPTSSIISNVYYAKQSIVKNGDDVYVVPAKDFMYKLVDATTASYTTFKGTDTNYTNIIHDGTFGTTATGDKVNEQPKHLTKYSPAGLIAAGTYNTGTYTAPTTFYTTSATPVVAPYTLTSVTTATYTGVASTDGIKFTAGQAGYKVAIVESTIGGTEYNKADISFEITDQYGKKTLDPTYFAVTNVVKASATLSPTYAVTNGALTVTGGVPQAGDEITLTATRDGVSKTITIKVK